MKTYMNKTIKTIVSALFIMPILASCKGDGKTMSIGKPEFVRGFPTTISELQKIGNFNCEEIGIREVKVLDSLLIISKADIWALYSLDGKHKYGEFLRIGNGPGEFVQYIPNTSWCHFFKDNDSLFVYAANASKGHVLGFNISEFLSGARRAPYPVIETDLISGALPAIIYGKEKILVYQPNYNYTNIKRMMYEGDTLRQMPVTQGIDKTTLGRQIDMNILSRGTCYNAAADKFVEVMAYLNQINIISGDGTEGKTICVGKRLDDISKIEGEDYASWIRAYKCVSAWDEGFGAVYSGATEYDPRLHISDELQIQFFDWEGNPRCLVELPYQTYSFDIDFENKVMYVLNTTDDKLIAYDATEIVKCLKS